MFDFYDQHKSNNLNCYFYFSNSPGSGLTDDEMRRIKVNELEI